MKYINEENLKNVSFINKDFQSLWTELLELVPKLTNKWNPSEANESDPLAVLLKLCAIVADKTNYNIDKNVLELYPLSLTQLRSAYNVYDVLGYTPKWYISATSNLTISYNGVYNASQGVMDTFNIPQFTQFADEDGKVIYTSLETAYINKFKPQIINVPVIEGAITSMTINGSKCITCSNMDINNRLYFPQNNVAQNGIFVSSTESDFSPSSTNTWEQVESLASQPLGKKCFSFGVDAITGSTYIEFPSDIGSLIGHGLYVNYIISSGENGNIKANTISKFLYEDAYIYGIEEGVNEELEIEKLENVFSITNVTAIKNGYHPESIDQMYNNYKKTVNILGSLVTLLDYQNYINSCKDKLHNKIVSNIQVSDRTNDLYCSVPVKTLTQSGESNRMLYFDDVRVIKKIDESGVVKYTIDDLDTVKPWKQAVNAFHLRFYPTDYKEITSKANYDKTFTSADLNSSQEMIEDYISEVKSINHDYLQARNPIVIPYALNAVIYLHNKVSSIEALDVKNNVLQALRETLCSKNLEFGAAPDYSHVLSIMEKADTRIKHIALQPIEIGAKNIDGTLDMTFLDEYTVHTTPGKEFEVSQKEPSYNICTYDVMSRAVLSGVTPATTFDTTFVRDFNGQASSDTVNGASVHAVATPADIAAIKSAKEKIEDDTAEAVVHVGEYSILFDLTNASDKDSKQDLLTSLVKNSLGIDLDNVSESQEVTINSVVLTNIRSGVNLDATPQKDDDDDYAPIFEVHKGEDISLFSPQYNVKATYANFLYFFCVSSKDKPVSVDTPYELSENDVIYIFDTKTACIDAVKAPQLRRKAIYTLSGKDTIVRFSDREGRYSAFNFRVTPVESDIYNMTTYVSIEELTPAEGKLKAAQGEDALLMATNSVDLKSAFSVPDTEYVLKTGEYLLYSDLNGLEVGILSEGSTVIATSEVENLTVLSTVSLEDAFQGDIGNVSNVYWTSVGSEVVRYKLNNIMTFGEGYQFSYRCAEVPEPAVKEPYFNKWLGDGNVFDIVEKDVILPLGEVVGDCRIVQEYTTDGVDLTGMYLRVTYRNGNTAEFPISASLDEEQEGDDAGEYGYSPITDQAFFSKDSSTIGYVVSTKKSLKTGNVLISAIHYVINSQDVTVDATDNTGYYKINIYPATKYAGTSSLGISSYGIKDGRTYVVTEGDKDVTKYKIFLDPTDIVAGAPSYYGLDDAGGLYRSCKAKSRLHYKLNTDTKWTPLSNVLEGDGWKGIIRLKINTSQSPQELLTVAGVADGVVKEVSHKQYMQFSGTCSLPRDVTDLSKGSVTYPIYKNVSREVHDPEGVYEQDNKLYLDSSLAIVSPGGSDIVLSTGEQKNFAVTSYLASSAPRSSQAFVSIDKYIVNGKLSIMVPGNTGQYAMFPAVVYDVIESNGTQKISEKSRIVYLCCPSKSEIVFSERFDWISCIVDAETENVYYVTQLGTPQVIKSGSSIYMGNNMYKQLSHYSGTICINDNPDYSLHKEFNLCYHIPENELIIDPNKPDSFFNEYHPFNRYSLAKFEESISNITISPLSISR